MKTLKCILGALVLMSWGVSLHALNAFPAAPFKVTIALPQQSVDFGDMDFRDENNRPIPAPKVKREFTEAFHHQLHVMLIESLTPARRALLALLDRQRNAFEDWIDRAVQSTARLIWTTTGKSNWLIVTVRTSIQSPMAAVMTGRTDLNQAFFALSLLMISTFRLLR